MRAQSHRHLGQYLVSHYMTHVPKHCIRAFLIGCIQPDRNPATYLKGSLRCQWLRGHNYRNARRLMRKFSWRLEQKDTLGIPDYYTLGKLIHYTADAFTYAHNLEFPHDLSGHRQYEAQLQHHFLDYLRQDPKVDIRLAANIMEVLAHYHREYASQPKSLHNDARFALHACCAILAILAAKGIPSR